MEKRNNNSHSAFYDLPKSSGSAPKKVTAPNGELQIFSEGLKRKTTAEQRPAPSKAVQSSYKPRRKKRKSRNKYKTRENRNVTLVVVMIYAAVGFFVGSLMIARYSNIIKTDDELDAIEAKIEEMQAEAEALELEVSLRDDIGMVQREARDRLGLYYPSNDQIIYIELDEEENVAENEMVQNESTIQ
ncbi:MAG: septum formation initiator family protein [Eubacteriales bacterium]